MTTDINSRKSIIAIVWLGVIGPCVFILQPGFVQGLVAYLGFTEQQAGQIASYEMFGVAATTVLLSFISTRVPWRRFLQISLVFCVVGNLASIGQTDFTLLSVTRFLTGLGSGGLVSISFILAGLTRNADRSFGLIVGWLLIYGAFGLLLMPTAYAVIGMKGLYVFFGVLNLSGFYFVAHLPDSGTAVELEAGDVEFSMPIKVVSLAGSLVYNTGIGIVWAYLFLVGLEADMTEQAVANTLTVSQFLGIAGAFSVVFLQLKFGRLIPLVSSILIGAASIYLIIGDIDSAMFWIGVCGFNFVWNVTTPYVLAMMADFDHRGRVVVHGVSMQFVGFAIGPFIAAQLVVKGGYDLVNLTSVAFFVVSAVLLMPGLLEQRKRMWLAKAGA